MPRMCSTSTRATSRLRTSSRLRWTSMGREILARVRARWWSRRQAIRCRTNCPSRYRFAARPSAQWIKSFFKLFNGVLCCVPAPLQFDDAEDGKVNGSVDVKGDHRQMRKLVTGHGFRVSEVPHINEVGLEQLIARIAKVAVEHRRRDRPLFQCGHRMRREALRPPLAVHITEHRLVSVQRDERHFCLHRNRVAQPFPAMLENHQLRALDVDLEQVELVDVEIIETMSLDVDLFDDRTPI